MHCFSVIRQCFKHLKNIFVLPKMVHISKNLIFVILYYVALCGGWKAIPANQAMYALRASHIADNLALIDPSGIPDVELPRDKLNFIYKFGNCEPDVTRPPFLRKSVNFTLPTWQSTQAQYIYLLAKKHTINHEMQCIVMKTFTAQKFLFKKSRLPLYYCQGTVLLLMLNTVNRYEIHEFYLHHRLNVPLDFSFEFYHPMKSVL